MGCIATSAAPAAAPPSPLSQVGGAGLKGSGEPQAKPPGAQGRGELGDHRVRPYGSGRRMLNQGKGGEKHLPFGGGGVGGEPRLRSDAGQVSRAHLQGGAEQEELVLPAEGKGGEGGDQGGDGVSPGASVRLDKRVQAEGLQAATSPSG
jgi:hypothetical protein